MMLIVLFSSAFACLLVAFQMLSDLETRRRSQLQRLRLVKTKEEVIPPMLRPDEYHIFLSQCAWPDKRSALISTYALITAASRVAL